MFDYTRWGFSDAKSTFDEEIEMGVMIDNGTQDLAGSGLNATDAMGILNIGSWLTWAEQLSVPRFSFKANITGLCT